MIRKTHAVAFFLSLFVFLISWSYYEYFSEALNNYNWLGVGGFTRIIIPDTFVYLSVIDSPNPIVSIMLAGVKNTIAPSLIWFVTDGNWVRVLFVNSACLLIGLIYFAKTAQLFNVPRQKIWGMMFLLALLPATIYYTIGALKEIQTLVFLTGFIYHYLKGDRIRWLLFAALIVFFRYQLAASLFLFLFADRFNKRSLNVTIIVLFFLSAGYPFIKWFQIFSTESTEYYRFAFGEETSLGGIVEQVRNTLPGISVFAVLIRTFQSIFEPLLSFIKEPTFYEDGDLSIINIVNLTSSVMLLRIWFLFLKRMVLICGNQAGLHRNVIRLYMLCLVTIIPIGGFSFIHHRYLYSVTSIVLLASVIRFHRMALPVKTSMSPIKTKVLPA